MVVSGGITGIVSVTANESATLKESANAAVSVEIVEILFEFCSERGVFDVVDLPLKMVVLGVIDCHAAAFGTKVRVIVNTEENVKYAVPLGDRAKKTAHGQLLLIV